MQCSGCEYIVELVEVKGSAVELISVVLEEIDPQTARVAQVCYQLSMVMPV